MPIPDSKDKLDLILTVQDVAEYLRIHQSTVYRLLKRRQLPEFKIGHEWRFNRESIDRWRTDAEQNLERAQVNGSNIWKSTSPAGRNERGGH
jgi:excisionase family DNA binding protein